MALYNHSHWCVSVDQMERQCNVAAAEKLGGSSVSCSAVTLLVSSCLWDSELLFFIPHPPPGKKCRSEARPTLRHVLKLREAAPGHPRTRGGDTRSGQVNRQQQQQHWCLQELIPVFPGEETAGDAAAGQRAAGEDDD